jgi:tetratricopeptide (TPR) repeat protein
MLKNSINFYASQQDYKRALLLAERLAYLYETDPDVWFNLAKLYAIIGDQEKTQMAADKTIALDKRYQERLPELEGIRKAGN